MLVDGAGVVVEHVGDHLHLAARAGDRLADVVGLDPRKLLGVLLDDRRETPKQARAIARRDGAPPGKRGRRARDGGVRLLDARRLQLRDHVLGRRIENRQSHGG